MTGIDIDPAAIAGSAASARDVTCITTAPASRWRIRHTLAVGFGAVSALVAGVIYAGETFRLPASAQDAYNNARVRLLDSFRQQEQPTPVEASPAPVIRVEPSAVEPAGGLTPTEAAARVDAAYRALWAQPRTVESANAVVGTLREVAAGEFSPRFEHRVEGLINGATLERNWRARRGFTADAN